MKSPVPIHVLLSVLIGIFLFLCIVAFSSQGNGQSQVSGQPQNPSQEGWGFQGENNQRRAWIQLLDSVRLNGLRVTIELKNITPQSEATK